MDLPNGSTTNNQPMVIRLKLFAILRERAGDVAELQLELPAGATAQDARRMVGQRFPSLRELLPRAAVAVNCDYVSASTQLSDGDELALIPPVSGG